MWKNWALLISLGKTSIWQQIMVLYAIVLSLGRSLLMFFFDCAWPTLSEIISGHPDAKNIMSQWLPNLQTTMFCILWVDNKWETWPISWVSSLCRFIGCDPRANVIRLRGSRWHSRRSIVSAWFNCHAERRLEGSWGFYSRSCTGNGSCFKAENGCF